MVCEDVLLLGLLGLYEVLRGGYNGSIRILILRGLYQLLARAFRCSGFKGLGL